MLSYILSKLVTFSMLSYILSELVSFLLVHLVDFIAISNLVGCCMPPGMQVFTTSWHGALDSGASQLDHRIQ